MGMRKNSIEASLRGRINIILLFFLLLFSALSVRLFVMQIIDHKEYSDLAARQHRLVKEIVAERGRIYGQDKNGELITLALNKSYKILAVSPKDVKNPQDVLDFLSENFGVEKDEVLKKLSKKDDPYEVIAKRIEPDAVEKLATELPAGIFLEEEKVRVYPHKTAAAQLLGFVSKETDEEEGRYGLERYYEKELSGKTGIFEGAKDTAGFWVALGRRIVNPPENGSNIILSVDYNIQLKTEALLASLRAKWQADSGAILVLDPRSGKILAMAANPVFDPNEFSKEKKFSVFLNPLVESMYELGSVLKPLTMAAGLEEKLVEPETTYDDPGIIKIGGRTIKNFDGKSYRTQTMIQVLEKSLNTGAAYVARLLGRERQLNYLKKFGFGRKTGVDLPGEVAGDISNLAAGREIDFMTASFGQGIAVTPLQLAMAVGAVANDGKLMKPYVVEKIIDDSGNETRNAPQVVKEIISKETAEKLTKMLVSAVRNGFENRAGVKGYFVAGKTGTAQIPRRDGPGYSDKVIHTFVGYAPAFNPRFLVLLQLNEPKGNRFAANTLTPVFHDLAEYILNYYEVPPDEK